MIRPYPLFIAQNTIIGKSNRRNILLSYGLLLFSFSLSGQTKYFVDSTNVTPVDGLSWATAFNSLQAALDVVAIGDTVWLAKGTYYPTVDPNSGGGRNRVFYLDKNIAIYGGFDGSETALGQRDWTVNLTILSGDLGTIGDMSDNAYHVLWLQGLSNAAFIDGFTITRGNANGATSSNFRGGGMAVWFSNPNIANCTFADNSAEQDGGAMANFNSSSPSLTNCTFENNTAGSKGGGMYNTLASNPSLTNCTFNGNAAGSLGGGMYNYWSSPSMTNCYFHDNNSNTDGGGMYNDTDLSNPSLTNCTFTYNFAQNEGGAIFNQGANPTITDCSFGNNTGLLAGGAIYNKDTANSIITNCIFNNNQADLGGAMYNFQDAEPLIINALFINNIGNLDGGAIYNNDANPTLINTTFYNNSSNQNGGAMRNFYADPILTNCILWENSASGSSASTSASIYNVFSRPEISYSLIANSGGSTSWDTVLGTDNGNNVDVDPLFVDAANGDLQLQNCSPVINAGEDGPNIEPTDLAGNPRIYGTIDMGAYENQTTASTRRYVDSTSTAITPDGKTWATAYRILEDAIAEADVCENIVEIWVAKGTYFPTRQVGGGNSRYATFYLTKNIQLYGGFNGTETLLEQRDWSTHQTILSGNIGNPNTNLDNTFHVLWTDRLDSSARIDGFLIEGGNANVSSSNFGQGGGMFNYRSAITVANCIFKRHSAYYGGGAVYNNYFTQSFINCVFQDNSARYGGAIYNVSASATFTNCIFKNNTTSDIGGAIFNSSSHLTITNCTFENNIAVSEGGAIFNNLSFPTIKNTVIWNNSAIGTTAATSSSIFNNSCTAYISYSLIANSGGSTSWHGAIGSNQGNNIDLDPLFVDATNYDLNLQSCSPAINAGTDSANDEPTDLAGNPRIYGTIDMGAYENQAILITRLHVDSSSTVVLPDGKSWATAYPSLEDALLAANACSNINEIWVAKGTYFPDRNVGGSDMRFKTFYLTKNIRIYGGFIGTEKFLEDRDWLTNPTFLSGDLGVSGSSSDNAFHVVWAQGLNNTARLDGFKIMEGNANGGGIFSTGGALYNANSDLIIANCDFENNATNGHGGAIYNNAGCSLYFENCSFKNNVAGNSGGAIYDYSYTIFTNCNFNNNTANYGGAVYNRQNSSTYYNCVFQNNLANVIGGAFYNYQSGSSLINCTIENNEANAGGGLYNTNSSSPSIRNCIIWGNKASGNLYTTSASISNSSSSANISYSLVANSGGSSNWNTAIGTDQGNNIDADPLFEDAANNDLSLQVCSPALNAGNDIYNSLSTDIVGNPRKYGTIDMGAYELQVGFLHFNTTRLYVNEAATETYPNGSSWTNAYQDLGDALAAANAACSNVEEIWVAKGTYYPTMENGGTGTRFQTFFIQKDFELYGGFDGTESNLVDRDIMANPTILSGDLGVLGDNSDNAYHVVSTENLSELAKIDGFTIAGGNADDGTEVTGISEGLYQNSSIEAISEIYENNSLSNNDGGGIFNNNSNPTISNCTLYGNTAQNNGGAILNFSSNPAIDNCVIYDNIAKQDGGAIFNLSSNPLIINSTFYNNTASTNGGGLFNLYSSPSLTNVILWSNTALESTTSTSASMANLYDANPSIAYSLIANSGGSSSWDTAIGTDNGNNIDTDPLFVDAANRDLQLQTCSPAMDKGTSIGVPSSDIIGNPRPFLDTEVDMGAYETQGEQPKPVAICQNISVYLDANGEVKINASAVDNGSSAECGIPVLTVVPDSFDCSNIGVNTVKLFVLDFNLHQDSCEAIVTVLDTVSPVPICHNITVPLDASGNASITATQIDNGSNDACGIASMAIDQTNFTCANVGDNLVTLTVLDNNGNSSTCTATVTITKGNAEMRITGGNPAVVITNGDTTPEEIDGTDFGTSTSQSFTIDNSSSVTDLEIGSIVLSDNTNFNLSNVPTTILAGNSSTFDVNFTALEGLFTSTVTITSSNCNYTVFTFTIQAGMEVPTCPSSLDITGIIPSDTYEASGIISSNGTVADTSNVIFKAGEIVLTIGFKVEPGGTFLAQVAPCIPPSLTEEEANSTEREVVEKILPENSIQVEQKQHQPTKKATLTIYPNPTNSQLNLLCDCEIVAYKIMDSSGKIVKEGRQSRTTIEQLDNLTAGLYFLQVLTREGSYNKQFVKQ